MERLFKLRLHFHEFSLSHILNLLVINVLIVTALTRMTFFINKQSGFDVGVCFDNSLTGARQLIYIYIIGQFE